MNFKDKLIILMNEFDIKDIELSRPFGVPITTVGRWCSGISTPHPIIQKQIFNEIQDIINRKQNDRSI